MRLLLRLSVLALMVVATVMAQTLADAEGWALPWYFIQELALGAVPMLWLLVEVYPHLSRPERWSFLVTSATFVSLASIFELIAIQNRYWWFYEDVDRLTGFEIGAIPVEEFIYYPILLNIPVLLYLLLRRLAPVAAPDPTPHPKAVRRMIQAGAALSLLAGAVLWFAAAQTQQPVLDYTIVPAPDAGGAIRYAAGPTQHSWTILQLLSLAAALLGYLALHTRLHRRALFLMVALYFPYAFFIELMACGRGWWVWNARQVSGLFTWVLPLDSYLMYVTGALLPVLLFVTLRRTVFRDGQALVEGQT